MRRIPGVCVLVMALFANGAMAQARDNPSLTAYERGVTQVEGDPGLRIETLRVGVNVYGRVAEVTLEARLTNVSDSTDEARFSLALPLDAVVMGYSLDVDGQMIDGVLVEQPKARNVYEDEVRKGIDPGLGEVTSANLFQTRVYPVTKDMPRTIRVMFAVPFSAEQGFVLPLVKAQPLTQSTMNVEIAGYKLAPPVRIDGKVAKLARSGDTWSVAVTTQDSPVESGISIGAAELTDALLVSRHRTGKLFFQISDAAVAKPVGLSKTERLRIYWDRSLSRRDDLLVKEMELLAEYVEATHPAAIDLVSFASDGPVLTTVDSVDALREALGKVVYRGGTSFAALDALKLASADQCLLFSDGLVTVGGDVQFRPDCRLSIITSAQETNRLRLATLAQSSRGQLLHLAADNTAALLQQLLKPAVAVVAVRNEAGHRVPFRTLPAADGGWFVVGEMPESGEVRLSIAGLSKGLVERPYVSEQRASPRQDASAVLWASQRVAELADDVLAHQRMVSLARKYQVTSPALAFLVLETPAQYLSADIRPPNGFGKEWMSAYRAAKRARDDQRDDLKSEHFKFVLQQWQLRKLWWSTRFTSKTLRKVEPDDARFARNAPALTVQSPAQAAVPMSDMTGALEEAIVTARRVDQRVEDVPVTISGLVAKDEQRKTIELDVAEALSDQPYLRALDAAPMAQRLVVLAEQERLFGFLPVFYLEAAEWFRLNDDTRTAESLLYSALELPTTDDETRQIVAFRLQRNGQMDRAIAILERIAINTDFRPQPKRALALALAERGRLRGQRGRVDLERAFALLTSITLNPVISDFDGIETIALMEANALIPVINALGGKWSLDARLVALLDTDVRIVIEWTADDADIDLWVNEPNGEKVFYQHQTSSSGGLISNDMTDGYGPEEYVIRRAAVGSYEIRINGYDADRLNPNGKGRVMVRMIRDFGRAKAKQTLVDADISFNRDADRLLARMKVEAEGMHRAQ
jgi:hypothetical protein